MILPCRLKLGTCFFVLLFSLGVPFGAGASVKFIPPEPRNIDNVDIYLLTRGAGEDIYTKYGHTMFRVVDPSQRLDVGYNWGAFDFYDPGFIVKFLRGFLLYYLDISDASREVEVSNLEQRWLVQEHLNLTFRQKQALLMILKRESQPERRYYRYLFFVDNCSTRPRNYIDEAIGGKIAARFQRAGSGSTFRDMVMDYNASSPVMAMGQDVILNSEADRPLSKWEEMFVPLKLREYLLTLPAYNDDGSARGREKLLSDRRMLVEFPDPAVPFYNGYMIFWVIIGTPLLLGTVVALKTSLQKRGVRIFGFALALWGAISGFFALYLTLSWAFSEHTVVHHNANLWLLWPVDWYYLFLGILLMSSGTFPRQEGLLGKFTTWITLGHLAALGIYALLALGGFFAQDVKRVLIYFGLLALFLYGFTFRLARS